MEALAAVLLQLNLFDVYGFSDHLTILFSCQDAVIQCAVYSDGSPLLSDLVSSLKCENTSTWCKKIQKGLPVTLVRCVLSQWGTAP